MKLWQVSRLTEKGHMRQGLPDDNAFPAVYNQLNYAEALAAGIGNCFFRDHFDFPSQIKIPAHPGSASPFPEKDQE